MGSRTRVDIHLTLAPETLEKLGSMSQSEAIPMGAIVDRIIREAYLEHLYDKAVLQEGLRPEGTRREKIAALRKQFRRDVEDLRERIRREINY